MTLEGAWVLAHLDRGPPSSPEPDAARLSEQGAGTLHLAGRVTAFDSAGALAVARLVGRWEARGWRVDMDGLRDSQRALVQRLASRLSDSQPPASTREGALARLGRATVDKFAETNAFVAFIGELTTRGGRLALRPWRIRWREVIAEIEAAGVRALGIVGLLSFLVGMVMAYQAGATLQDYGANVLIVNLVGILTLREMGPLLTAIIVAGRTGSSYTAQLGTMRLTEEIDALRAIGVSPFEILVMPKVIALILVMPLLTVFANLMGLLGGAVVAASRFDVGFAVYLARLPEVVDISTLLLGLVKTPVFAIVIALVGCLQGMRVASSALAVGRATTVSVVQATFLVIVLDALFSVLFNLLGY
ncbi:MAG: ABC transporter permease [Halothiobacillaceae bacterium]|nr:ABC transporter permease [Halothiobacillaceae bacterium]